MICWNKFIIQVLLMKKKWFTLLEIIISITWFFLLMTVVINSYLSIMTFRHSFNIRAKLIENTYYMFEKINLLLRDYTIDYEEYFNRSRIGCDAVGNFSWSVWINGYCDMFTAFGNNNSFQTSGNKHSFYYCSSYTGYSLLWEYVVYNPLLSTWCTTWTFQSFGQYKRQFLDVKDNVDFDDSVVGDSDDTDLGKWPESIVNATWVKELYLISQDQQYRVFIRRALIDSWDFNWDWVVSWDNEFLYTLQILKLRSFDAWNNHDFDINNSSGVYDSVLDTWACDYSQWFFCDWNSLWNIYSWYRIPLDDIQYNSGWVNLFDNSITVTDWNIIVYPTKNPEFAWMEPYYQIAPYFTISIKTKPYWWVWQKKLKWSIVDYQLTLQTTFTTKYSR